jgi:hypothetical protein
MTEINKGVIRPLSTFLRKGALNITSRV